MNDYFHLQQDSRLLSLSSSGQEYYARDDALNNGSSTSYGTVVHPCFLPKEHVQGEGVGPTQVSERNAGIVTRSANRARRTPGATKRTWDQREPSESLKASGKANSRDLNALA